MAFWKYRAFDQHRCIHEGITTSPDSIAQLALLLRQQGLQIIEATKISGGQYSAMQKLQLMKLRTETKDDVQHNNVDTRIRRWLSSLINLIQRRKNASF